MIFALLLLVAPEAYVDPKQQDVPIAYRGTWAPTASACKERDGAEQVRIGARRIDLYEAHGYLTLAQLNLVSDPPEFHGRFEFVGGLRFWQVAIRLRMRAGKMTMTQVDDDPDAPDSPSYVKCR